ncbi:hypothetical protein QJS04_geneDACA016163 [Acorus gramineus]|uniref:Phytocyanin domain-containing protein n=1 Tax=Acorus gramineus TaxID=55184 RepID=A0AAV9ANM4_ACOGR|nr:hypothetical protein QJS04_geneDACA016163 [Acorus gramineus]
MDGVTGFTFTTGAHNVFEVSKSDYDSCTTSNPITSQATSPATLTLSTASAHYYICGFPSHCSSGQKLSVNVLPSSTTPSTTPSLAGGPISAPPPSSGSGSGGGGSSSASSSTLPGFGLSVVFAAAVVAAPLLF